MHPSYSSYLNNINFFNIEEYKESVSLTDSYTSLINFITFYKEIESEDLKKPIFSQTTKFKKNINTTNNYKYLKIARDKSDVVDKNESAFLFKNPIEDNEKISVTIKSYLNKISTDTYKKVSFDLINELVEIKNENLFNIISYEIINKCLHDHKYRNLYINICSKIWGNKQIHFNLIEIVLKNSNYYWKLLKENSEYNGPFTSEMQAKNDAYDKLNFKKFFVNYIQQLYINKDIITENLDDEEFFLKKKKVLLTIEIISILYLDKYIKYDIINIVIIDLLHLNNFKKIEDIEYEALYTLFKLIKEKNKYSDGLFDNKIIINEYINIIQKILEHNEISKRSQFFLNDIIDMLTNVSDKKNKKDDFHFKEKEKDNKENIINLIPKHIEKIINSKKIDENILKILNNINIEEYLFNYIDKLINNIDDIKLDIPDVVDKLINLVNSFTFTSNKKNEVLNKLKNIESYEEESDEEESDEECSMP